MNATKFLHTRVEFSPQGSSEVHFGWVSHVRNLEVCIAVPGGTDHLNLDPYEVKLTSESASVVLHGPIIRKSGDQVWFRLPLPLDLQEGDDNARVQVRGLFACVRTQEFDFIAELEDLSLTGMAFIIPVVCEPEERLRIHMPSTQTEEDLFCEVRYCVKVTHEPNLYRIGVRYMDLTESQGTAIRELMLHPISRAS